MKTKVQHRSVPALESQERIAHFHRTQELETKSLRSSKNECNRIIARIRKCSKSELVTAEPNHKQECLVQEIKHKVENNQKKKRAIKHQIQIKSQVNQMFKKLMIIIKAHMAKTISFL